MTNALTDSVVVHLKPRRGQTDWAEISDGGCRGLCLRLSPRGEKNWAVRHMVGGKRQRHTIGAYPALTLSVARERARDYLAGAKDGMGATEVDARARALTLTLADAHQEYVESFDATLRANTKGLKKAMVRHYVKPVIGDRLIRTVRRHDVIDVVVRVAAKGFKVQANRVFSELMALLRWCEQKGYVDGVPSIRKKDLRTIGAAAEQARRRTLADVEISEAWEAAGGLCATSSDYVRVLLLLGQRRDEVRLMTRTEVDLDQALWTIPKDRYKTKVDHAVPLPPAAVEILRRRLRETNGDYVFAAHDPKRGFNGAASALRQLRKRMKNRPPFTLHDLRRTCRTTLSRLGVDEETAELVIGHLPQGMAKTYNLHDRLAERRAALEQWTEFVQSLAEGKVVPISKGAAA